MSIIQPTRQPLKVYHRAIHRNDMSHWLHRRGKSMPVEDLTDDQVHDIHECFELFDADHSGALDVDEVMEAASVLGLDSGGGGGMLSQLLGEMENEGIDELDYPRFESVICRALGDIALARSRAQEITTEETNVLDGTRERAMIFKRKQLLGGLLRGGQDLADLASSQDELLDEIAKRFRRVVQMDGIRTKEEQIKELLLELDPVASGVAPVMSQRFKHLQSMAGKHLDNRGTNRNIAEAPEKADNIGRRKSVISAKSRGRLGYNPSSGPVPLNISFGGDRLEIGTPRHTSSGQPPVDICMPQATSNMAIIEENDTGANEQVPSSNNATTTKHFVSREIASLSGLAPGSFTLRSLPVSEFYAPKGSENQRVQMDCRKSSVEGEMCHVSPYDAFGSQPNCTRAPETDETTVMMEISSDKQQSLAAAYTKKNHAKSGPLRKVLATSSSAIPTCAIVAGRIVDTDAFLQEKKARERSRENASSSFLHRKVPMLQLDNLGRQEPRSNQYSCSKTARPREVTSESKKFLARRNRGWSTSREPGTYSASNDSWRSAYSTRRSVRGDGLNKIKTKSLAADSSTHLRHAPPATATGTTADDKRKWRIQTTNAAAPVIHSKQHSCKVLPPLLL